MIPICVIHLLHYHLHYNLNFLHFHHHNFQVPLRYLILLISHLLQHLQLIQYLHLIQHPLHFLLFEFIFSLTNPSIKIVIFKVLHFKLLIQLTLQNPQCLIFHHLLKANYINILVPRLNCHLR